MCAFFFVEYSMKQKSSVISVIVFEFAPDDGAANRVGCERARATQIDSRAKRVPLRFRRRYRNRSTKVVLSQSTVQ